MRIGLLAPKYQLSEGGGYTFEKDLFAGLIRHCSTSNHILVVFSRERKPTIMDDVKNLEWVVVRFVFWRNLIAQTNRLLNYLLNKALKLPSIFENENWIDPYLISHRIEFFVNMVPETATYRTPYLSFIWDLQHREYPYFPESFLDGRWVRWEDKFSSLVRRSAVVCVGTEVGKREIMNLYQIPEQVIRLLPHPTPSFAVVAGMEEAQDEVNLPDVDSPYLFYPANFFVHKNHITVLYALALLRDKYSIRFDLVLSGIDSGNMEHVKTVTRQLGLLEQVHFLGFVSQKELVQLYRGAFALVYASLLGPENLPPLEAFAIGCPVIAADISGAREQLNDSALFFSPLDENNLAEQIIMVKNDLSLRSELIAHGKTRADKFTADDMAVKIFEILDEFEPVRRCWGNDYIYRNPVNIRRLFGG